ncbi:class I SAM-dependent methyltransferase [Cryptosporangium aurantiacum]|uniref:Methyltransferase domain-containing protein n=1 Tax=Cryptosporangium aurantiacum TaxID=134849 RepID=A0A1M7RNG7_9ACTN|nr:class I SAM-dependent methyltransferase [Cryptosporangium aurantiacum]SHN47875.1 Methyltransferase domain-containing protein [Cryptosporangium aurantiacum]
MTTTLPSPVRSGERPSRRERFGAAIYDPFLALGERRGMAQRRDRLLAGARGAVLEIGAGTGLNLAHYPSDVRALIVSEPDAGMRAVLERRVGESRVPAVVSPASASALPFEDAAFDTVVSTLVLCTVEDPAAAAAEVRRVLRPGGRFLVIEHVRAVDGSRLARWQHRLAGPWKALAAGCRCDQSTGRVLTDAGFDVETLWRDHWSGMPAIVGPLVVGALAAPDA